MAVKRALLSVSNKKGIVEFARALDKLGVEILSTGGTSAILKKALIKVTDVSEYTGSPEIMNGRVKTLHPKIHGGILCNRDDSDHIKDARKNQINMIDMVVVNLYPFSEIANKSDADLSELIENIDIGGPSMIRSAAKNYKDVIVVTDINDYKIIMQGLSKDGDISLKDRERLALKAFKMTSEYDFAIEKKLCSVFEDRRIERIRLEDVEEFGKYAENWHQSGFKAKINSHSNDGIIGARKLKGQEMGYNNYLDASFALKLTNEFDKDKNCVAVLKHGNPCGLSVSDSPVNSLERAWQGDSISAFGSVISCNQVFDLELAKTISERLNSSGKKGWFVELIIAPDFSDEALEYLDSKKSKKNLRLLKTDTDNEILDYEYRSISGGIIAQRPDDRLYLTDSIETLFKESYSMQDINSQKDRVVGIVSEKKPEISSKGLYEFSWISVKYIHSNAICIAREFKPGCYQILGMGSGQPNRKDSTARLALAKAGENLEQEYSLIKGIKNDYLNGILQSERDYILSLRDNIRHVSLEKYIQDELSRCVLSSDAFFPFSDGVLPALEAGIKGFIQPGGSVGDNRIISTINKHGAEMIFTGMRHFLH